MFRWFGLEFEPTVHGMPPPNVKIHSLTTVMSHAPNKRERGRWCRLCFRRRRRIALEERRRRSLKRRRSFGALLVDHSSMALLPVFPTLDLFFHLLVYGLWAQNQGVVGTTGCSWHLCSSQAFAACKRQHGGASAHVCRLRVVVCRYCG